MRNSLYHLIASSGLFRGVASSFFKVTGIHLKLLPVPWREDTLPEPPSSHGCCELLVRSPLGRATCHHALSQLHGCDGAAPGPCQARCAAALIELSMPVLAGGDHFATLAAGPMLGGKPERPALQRLLSTLRIAAPESEWRRAQHAYLRTPVLSRDQRAATQQLLAFFAGQLGESATRSNETIDGHPEPVCVTCAKRFVEQHLLDDMHTQDAARAANLSLQHFCRVFHKTTGSTFTAYLSRQRVERAKKLLANPQLGIAQVAFESGFRSLPWFDRVFKRHTGRSPSEYRGSPQPPFFQQPR